MQPLNAGGEHVTAWREVTRGTRRTLFTSVAWSHSARTAVRKAIANVRCGSIDALAVDHRLWWHEFYRRSFLSIPDKRLEAFCWILLYKFASAARKRFPRWRPVDLDAVTHSVDSYRDVLVDQVPAEYRHDSAGIPRTTDTVLNNGAGVGNSGSGVGVPVAQDRQLLLPLPDQGIRREVAPAVHVLARVRRERA
ncbi:hypothetical protein AB0M48_18035 [Lentzea sp. NPDC051208]|uniref:hypothetical protein n=1 Tax=Lentzea sp. NPDC051208 TaxID=3154642 RepID=UPI0034273409